jgi:hypothetical protein
VPESAQRHAERKTRARAAGRRRRAADTLRIAEAVAGYAARQVGNGLAPEEARRAVLEAAAELELMAAELRALARLDGRERRALARQLAGFGMGTKRIAATVGVSERTARNYVKGRGCP